MDNESVKMRGLNTLTTNEIIAMADVLAFCSRTVTGGGDMRYRKIEAKLAPTRDQLSCRVSFAESVTDDRQILAFIIEPLSDDIIIKGVNRQKYTQKVIDDYRVNFDFGLLEQSLKENYLFFADQLHFWSGSTKKIAVNPSLSETWVTIDEYSLRDSELSELV
jgi:hypothetical protein